MEPPPTRAPGAPTTPAKAPGVTVGSVLGAAVFILTMGMSFAGDAPVRGFDEEGIPLNKLGMRYPRVLDPRTGKIIPFPDGELVKIPEGQRTEWDFEKRQAYIREWQARGYPRPPSNWIGVPHIHHIKPLAHGGTNDFWNLVPLDPEVHKEFTKYWNNY